MSMILVFDLDDTLYDERLYVESGLRAVADFGEQQFGWDADASCRFMVDVLDAQGRGAIFDRWLDSHGRVSRALVQECVKRYRHHMPRLRLDPAANALLRALGQYPLYLVTDGHKIAQARKVEALGIEPLFRKVFITHRYGIARAKPSTYCFERILAAEGAAWPQLVYVGDNPAKDFVNLNVKGAQTVRVLTGMHKDVVAARGYEAQHRIAHLGAFQALLPRLEAVARSALSSR
jgi:putative hydrolase of the HAD superfamily